jgi:hypothetical protein
VPSAADLTSLKGAPTSSLFKVNVKVYFDKNKIIASKI